MAWAPKIVTKSLPSRSSADNGARSVTPAQARVQANLL